MISKRNTALFLFIIFIFSSTSLWANELIVAVSANVQYAFSEIRDEFQKETGVSVKEVVGSSGKLVAQIENGAPFDIFLSADLNYPKVLQEKGMTYGSLKTYAYGTLVLWMMNEVDLSTGINVILSSQFKNIAIASPKTSPYGQAAMDVLKHYNLFSELEKRLVYGESIAQVNQFIVSKAAEAGFTSKSSVFAPDLRTQGRWIEIDGSAYEPITQGVVILKHAEKENLEAAKRFFSFFDSDKARSILEKYGYLLP